VRPTLVFTLDPCSMRGTWVKKDGVSDEKCSPLVSEETRKNKCPNTVISVQMSNVTPEYCADIIQKFEVSEENKEQNVLGIEGFTNFMRSPACDVFNPLHCEVHQDMDQPLCNYFIASSHNTYLTGDQLLSQSRVEMYARVLQDGCRCIEVDCWDGPDGEPVVHHGYTLTSKIFFRDVAETINKYAFIKNEFPVILSIENHCSIQQQKKIAQYLKEILGDKLDLSSVVTGDSRQLPSPQNLKGKILVKGKKLPCSLGADAEEGEVSDEDSADEIEDDCKLKSCYSNGATEHQVESFIRTKLESLLKESQIRDKEDPDSFTVRALLRATHEGLSVNLKQVGGCFFLRFLGMRQGDVLRLTRRRKTVKLCRALSDLVVYTNSVAAQDIVDDGSTGNVLSFSETRAHQAVQQKAEQFMLYNQKQLTRVYPSAYRIDSSNFNPLPYWNVGCQLVALNYQSEGRMMQLNEAKFRVNGNCGYVLKPQQMCKGSFNPYSSDPLPASPKKQLILKIISGQQLPKPPDSMLGDRGEIIDPFVEVEIIGLPVDCCKDQTRVVDDNGFNPVWEETLTFTIHMPEIALVRFLVWDHDPIGRDFVGQRTLAFSSLVPGYRHVYLEGLTEASIFVHITINEIYGKNKQLIGLRGLFNKNPKHSSAESSAHYVRKRSIGDRILRRTASAPAKGRKKSKMGFLEASEIKDSASEPADLKDKEGVVRRTSRSLQARPASMPVDKFLLVGLPCAEDETAQDAKGKENATERKIGSSFKNPCSISPHRVLISNSASLLKKESAQKETAADLSLVPPPQEQPEHLVAVSGVTETNRLIGSQESHLPVETVPLIQDSGFECITEKIQGKNCAGSKREDGTDRCKEEKITPVRTCLPEKVEEAENLQYDIIQRSTVACLSLTDISSAVCSDAPDLCSSLTMHDSDISRLIDEVSLVTEGEMDSAVSALIGQLDVTDDQTSLTTPMLPGAGSQTFGAAATHTRTAELSTPCKNDFIATKSSKSPLFSTPDAAVFSSPETAEYSVYTIIHEATLTPGSEFKTHSGLVGKKKSKSVENNLSSSFCSSPFSLLNANPQRKCETSWKTPGSVGSFASSSLIFEEMLVDPPMGENSESSSLVELGGDSQDLLVTACAYKREDVSQLASPLKLRQQQDSRCCGERTFGNCASAGLCAAALGCSDNFRTAGSKLPFPACENAGFLHHHHADKQKDLMCTSRTSQLDVHSPVLRSALAFPPSPAIKQTSPCKSKSLGDLTSEDISCNFESKYQYISRSFITSGMRDKKLAAMKTMRPHSTDALTEQLRKLLSLDQDDSHQMLYSRQLDEDCPKALVRKLSSRSQSRVRNIASRAKERQEASKQKSSNAGSVAGVVLRNKPSVSPHVVNRHSTGSYIARYLGSFPEEAAEGRGRPEGTCAAWHHGCAERLCAHSPLLQLEPDGDEKPEIYFLLRL
uniref:Phosphoinositide phospholipase C n=1 Tax=Pavo cristatus TaxID=9049 RepID=A0A8C9F1C2_PAVCR